MSSKLNFLWVLILPIILSIILLRPYVSEFVCEKLEPLSIKRYKPAFGYCPSHISTYAMVKPGSVVFSYYRIILEMIDADAEIYLHRSKKVWLTKEAVESLYSEHVDRSFFKELVFYVSSGPVIIMEIKGKNAVKKWRELIGPTDPLVAQNEAPNSIRAKIGIDKTMNAVHGSDSEVSASRELDLMFSRNSHAEVFELPTVGFNYTLLIIQPSIQTYTSDILKRLSLQGFKVKNMTLINIKVHPAFHKIRRYFNIGEKIGDFAKDTFIEDGESSVFILKQENAIQNLLELMGRQQNYNVRNPNRLSNIYGTGLLPALSRDDFKTLVPLLFDNMNYFD